VRTGPRIGPWRGDQPESPGDVGVATAHLREGVDVSAVDPRGEMHSRDTMGEAGGAHSLTSGNPLAGGERHALQIGQGDLETWDRFDGHGAHPGDGAGESDPARGRGPHHGTLGCAVVHPPMTRVKTDRRIPGEHLSTGWRGQAHGSYGKCSNHHLPWAHRIRRQAQLPGVQPLCSG
jgi:hypothetical protein